MVKVLLALGLLLTVALPAMAAEGNGGDLMPQTPETNAEGNGGD